MFCKKPLTIAAQIAQLQERGLEIPNTDLATKLNSLFENYPNVDPNALGMKPNWQNEPLWQQ